jgi:hypothetical protein
MTYLDIQKFHRKLQQNINKKNVKTFYENSTCQQV